MKNRSWPILGALSLLGALIWTAPAAAHHSFAMFDFSKTETVKGTVTEFRWTNPHVALLVQFDPKPGAAPEVWSMELTSPGNLTRGGWTRHSFKPGDRIELVFNMAEPSTRQPFSLPGRSSPRTCERRRSRVYSNAASGVLRWVMDRRRPLAQHEW
jgi:hypothetical protein